MIERTFAVSLDLRVSLPVARRVRGLFDPLLEALPTLGVLAVLLVGSLRIEAGDLVAGDLIQVAYLGTGTRLVLAVDDLAAAQRAL